MKKNIIFIITIIAFVFPAFDDPIIGLESLSMGNSKTAIRSVSSVNINPAISCFIQRFTIGGLSQIQSSFSDEGVGFGMSVYSAIPVTTQIGLNAGLNYYGFGGVDYPNVNKFSTYNEYIISGGASYKLLKNISLGLSLKYQMWNLNVQKKTTGLNGGNFNLTGGLYFNKLFDIISIGISGDNLLLGNASSTGTADKLPINIYCGLLFEFNTYINVVTEINYSTENIYSLNLGGSIKLLNDKMKILVGSELSDEFKNILLTSGIQYNIGFINIRYAFQYPLIFTGSFGYHYLGVVFNL